MKITRKYLWLAPAVMLLAGAAGWRTEILRPRAPARAFLPPPEDMPPTLLFTTAALGGFRGIIADLLWMRAINLQETGDVLEIAQLSDWITAMAPHLTAVWTFHAWNMAYNISIMFTNPEDRWRWVRHGIHLLRDRALVYNPGHPALLRELGWLYQHKIGFVMDSAHRHYKMQMADEMQTLLGGPRPDYQAPPEAEPLRTLRDQYKLLPATMAALDRAYGPLDWRLPATHALYWSYQGRRADPLLPGVRECYQMFYQCMAESFRHGQLRFDPATGLYITTPALELLPHAIRAHTEALAVFDTPTFHQAYANFLAEAVVILHVYNRRQRAQAIYQELITQYPNPDGDPALDDFVFTALAGNIAETPREDVIALIEGALFQSWMWLALGDTDRANGANNMAGMVWQRYMQTRVSEDHRQRTGLPPLPELRRQALQRALTELPAEPRTALQRLTPEK